MMAMLWGYAISGLVGIVGTSLGAWLTGRWQTTNLKLSLDAEAIRAQRAEKIELYAAFHTAYHAFFVISTSSIDRTQEPGRTIYNQSLTAINDAADRVCMMVPDYVSDVLFKMLAVTDEYLNEYMIDKSTADSARMMRARAKLLSVIRKDLQIDN